MKIAATIARAYLAAIMPDFRYRQTTATLDEPTAARISFAWLVFSVMTI
jgi:hypothetical protein